MLRAVPLRRTLSSLVLVLSAAAPLRAGIGAEWGPVTILSPRPPLEFGASLPGVELPGVTPFAELFGSVPELQLVKVDLAAEPPSATFTTIQADGSIFALGAITQLPSGRIGGSYADNFDLEFFSCAPPCNTVSVATVDAGPELWIDSSSGRTGNQFFVASVDNATGTIHLRRSTDGGTTWTPVRTHTPAGGVYRNFDGGERVNLVVDSNALDPAKARNCLFYERLVDPTTTAKRINCANGDDVLFDVPVGGDVPNAQGQPDKFIENTFRFEDLDVFAPYDNRSDQSVHLLHVRGGGGQDNVTIGAAPVGQEFFSYGMARSGDDRLDVIFPTNNGVVSNHQRIDTAPPPPFPTDYEVGPTTEQGPFWILWPTTLENGNGFLYAFVRAFAFDLAGGDGLGVALYPVAIFADGFGSADSGRWSGAVP